MVYQILITGVGIVGKTSLAGLVEKDLSKKYPVVNKDIDYDRDALIVPRGGIYIFQTPHGCRAETEDRISFTNFNKILYLNPDMETYIEFLKSRGCAWFEEGVVERGKDKNPRPYSSEKLAEIFGNVMGYAIRKEERTKEDIKYFKGRNLRIEILKPIIEGPKNLCFEGYSKVLEQILKEAELKNDY